MFYNGVNFCDFLFAVQKTKSLWEELYSKNKAIFAIPESVCFLHHIPLYHYHSLGIFSRPHIDYNVYASYFFFQKIGFDFSCKLSPPT